MPAEARAQAADAVAQERGGLTTTGGGRTAPGYVRGLVSPDGHPVTFVPGERLPDWAVEAIDARELAEVAPGTFEVAPKRRQRGGGTG